MKEDNQKSSIDLILFLFLDLVSFYEHYYGKEKGLELVTNAFSGNEDVSKLSVFRDQSSGKFWCFYSMTVEISRKLQLKIYGSHYMTSLFHFQHPLNILKSWTRKRKITKMWISWKLKEHFWWEKKNAFSVIFSGLS